MIAMLTNSGFIHIRCDSSETKPARGESIEVFDNATKGRTTMTVIEGAEAFEMDTGTVYMMGQTGWEAI